MRELARNNFAVITKEGGFVRVRRTKQPMPKEPNRELDDVIDSFRMAVPLRERKNLGLLLDTREAPIVADDATVEVMRPMMDELFRGFPLAAILVQTAVGVLQATRRSRGEALLGRATTRIFSDEAAAIAYLTGQSSTGPISRR